MIDRGGRNWHTILGDEPETDQRQAPGARINCSFTTMLSYAIILNHNDPVGFAGVNLASISLYKTNKQNQHCIFILTQHSTVPEWIIIYIQKHCCCAGCLTDKLKCVALCQRSLWLQSRPVEIVIGKKLWLSTEVLFESEFYPAVLCSPAAFIHCWLPLSIHSPTSKDKELLELTLRQIKDDYGRKIPLGLEDRTHHYQEIWVVLWGKKQPKVQHSF